MPPMRVRLLSGAILLFLGSLTAIAREDSVVTLTNDLGCWLFAAPPPPYRVYIRRSGSAPAERFQFGESVFSVALGFGPTGEALVARYDGVYRLTPAGPMKLFELPSGFAPSALLGHRSGKIYVLGNTRFGNAVGIWNGSGTVVVEPTGGNTFITSVDLAEDGCTAIWAAGNVYRTNLCAPPRKWEIWIAATHASAAFFAPNGEVLVQSLRETSSGGYTGVMQVRDVASLDVLREYAWPRTHWTIGLSSDGRHFWMRPEDCGGADFTLRKHDLQTGGLVSEQVLMTDFEFDRPHIGMVEYGWRAALAGHHAVVVPMLDPRALFALAAVLAAIAWRSIR